MNSQAPLDDQLRELIHLANRAGLYDAADYIRDRVEAASEYNRLHRSMGYAAAPVLVCDEKED